MLPSIYQVKVRGFQYDTAPGFVGLGPTMSSTCIPHVIPQDNVETSSTSVSLREAKTQHKMEALLARVEEEHKAVTMGESITSALVAHYKGTPNTKETAAATSFPQKQIDYQFRDRKRLRPLAAPASLPKWSKLSKEESRRWARFKQLKPISTDLVAHDWKDEAP